MRSHCISAFGVLTLIASSGVHASILFTYEDPDSSTQEFTVHQPAMPGEMGSVHFDSTMTISLRIDAGEEMPGAVTHVDVNLFFHDWTIGTVTQVSNVYIADTAGVFEFRRVSDGELVLRGEFGDGTLLTLFGSGSQQTARNEAGGTLVLSPGPALFDELLSVGYALPGIAEEGPSSASWSLADIDTLITPETLVLMGDQQEGPFFPSFGSDSAFVARATVPTPGPAAALTLTGVLCLARRRR